MKTDQQSDVLSGEAAGRPLNELANGLATEAAGLRMTRQRRVILDEFRTAGLHHTADDVYLAVRRKLPNISLGTVYRNLEVLTQAGLIRKLHLGGGQRLYDGGHHPHYHVRCRECGKISDVPADVFGDLEAAAREACNFEIVGHELGFEGVCSECGAALAVAAEAKPEQTDSAAETGTGYSASVRSRDSFSQQEKGV